MTDNITDLNVTPALAAMGLKHASDLIEDYATL